MRIVFIGTGEIGVPTLRAASKSKHELVGVVTQPDKPVGRDQKIKAPPIKDRARWTTKLPDLATGEDQRPDSDRANSRVSRRM